MRAPVSPVALFIALINSELLPSFFVFLCEWNFFLDSLSEISSISSLGIFALGIKDKAIKLFYVLGDEIREITPASDEFAKSLAIMQDEIDIKGRNKDKELWKQFIKNIYH